MGYFNFFFEIRLMYFRRALSKCPKNMIYHPPAFPSIFCQPVRFKWSNKLPPGVKFQDIPYEERDPEDYLLDNTMPHSPLSKSGLKFTPSPNPVEMAIKSGRFRRVLLDTGYKRDILYKKKGAKYAVRMPPHQVKQRKKRLRYKRRHAEWLKYTVKVLLWKRMKGMQE